MLIDTLIIGGGLSGLALAAQLAAQGRDFLLVEARDRLGGRILTRREGAAHYDLGPTWF
ncbi:MAG: FAD-dependent oxidoreductase [Candidatus Macondimonas sp.]